MLNDKMPSAKFPTILPALTNARSKVAKLIPLQFGSQITAPNNNNDSVHNNQNNSRKPSFGSSVAIHKLRDTKWFGHSEERIFCAVVESGFIVERKLNVNCELSQWGIAIWQAGKEKTKKPEFITIYHLHQDKNNKIKILKQTIKEFWTEDSIVRINNRCDKERTPNTEAMIRSQIETALKSGQRLKWHNPQHFVHWCRYGQQRNPDQVTATRTRQLSECLKWGNLGLNAGVFLLHQQKRQRAVTQ